MQTVPDVVLDPISTTSEVVLVIWNHYMFIDFLFRYMIPSKSSKDLCWILFVTRNISGLLHYSLNCLSSVQRPQLRSCMMMIWLQFWMRYTFTPLIYPHPIHSLSHQHDITIPEEEELLCRLCIKYAPVTCAIAQGNLPSTWTGTNEPRKLQSCYLLHFWSTAFFFQGGVYLQEQKSNIVSINAAATSSLEHIFSQSIFADTPRAGGASLRLGMTLCVEPPSDNKDLEPVSSGSIDWSLACVWLHQSRVLCLIFIVVQALSFKRSAILFTWLSSSLSSALVSARHP